MYESFYGLKEPAFTLTPNPEFLYLNDRSREALDRLVYGVERREGFAVITGDVGTGKTTLSWALLEKLEGKRVKTALIQKPMFSDTDMLRSILQDLGVRPPVPSAAASPQETAGQTPFDSSWMSSLTKKDLIDRLDAFLVAQAEAGMFTLVIIDEAQNLSMESLEQLRLLSNLETARAKLIQFIFVGQLELEQNLVKPTLRQLNQRISFRFATRNLSRKDTEGYIHHRLRVAGADRKLRFERRAFDAIYRYSKGYPRLINMICDKSLFSASQQHSFVVTAKNVRRGFDAIREPLQRRTSVWIKWIVPAASLLGLCLWIGFHFTSKTSDRPPTTPSSASAAAEVPAIPQSKVPESPRTEPAVSSPVAPAVEAGNEAHKGSNEAQTPDANSRLTPEPSGQPVAEEYLLQVYTFRNQKSAEAEAAQLTREGYPSFAKVDGVGRGRAWFAVYAGPYKDLSAALKAGSTLRSSKKIIPVLRRRNRQ